MKLCRLLPYLLLPAALFGAAPIEFTGVLVSDGGKVQVFLFNTLNQDFKLVPVGGKFGGYIVEDCIRPSSDKPEIVLASVTNPSSKQSLRIKAVSVGVSAAPSGPTTPATSAAKPAPTSGIDPVTLPPAATGAIDSPAAVIPLPVAPPPAAPVSVP